MHSSALGHETTTDAPFPPSRAVQFAAEANLVDLPEPTQMEHDVVTVNFVKLGEILILLYICSVCFITIEMLGRRKRDERTFHRVFHCEPLRSLSSSSFLTFYLEHSIVLSVCFISDNFLFYLFTYVSCWIVKLAGRRTRLSVFDPPFRVT